MNIVAKKKLWTWRCGTKCGQKKIEKNWTKKNVKKKKNGTKIIKIHSGTSLFIFFVCMYDHFVLTYHDADFVSL